MAITADFIMAVAVRPSDEKPRIRIANLNSEKFPTREFDIPEGEIPIDSSEHEWTNYFKSGLKGVSELLQKKRGKFQSVGMDIVCDGTVPSGGGLSSSASVVCTSALAVLAANGEDNVDKKELCELAIVSERAVGVNSGGLVLLTTPIYALLISPLAWTKQHLSSLFVVPPSTFRSSPASTTPTSSSPQQTPN